MRRILAVTVPALAFLLAGYAPAQTPSSGQDMAGMPGMSMPEGKTAPGMKGMQGADEDMNSMDDMDMGPHMKMTASRPPQPGDAQKAQQIVEAARQAMEPYKDYHYALSHGFQIFRPNTPQKQYHFTNRRNAMEARVRFDPAHPTSLLYEKQGNGYKLIGVMYTAPKSFTEDDLNARVPLSVAHWHEHINYCAPPPGQQGETMMPHAEFGLRGSITTASQCSAAGGTFYPVLFNWMLHVYPFAPTQAKVWSTEMPGLENH